MKLSIITAVHNSKETIEDCLKSVASQTYADVEHIIIDGGSTDGSKQLIEGISQKEKRKSIKFISEKDNGIYDALNKGIKMSSGDVIGLLHADDLFADNNVIHKIQELLDDKAFDGVYSDLIYVSKNDTNKIIRIWKTGEYKTLNYGWMPPHPTLFLRREVFDKIGFYDSTFKIASDYDFILRLFKDRFYNLKYLPEITIKMRLGGKSNKSLKNILSKSIEDYKAATKNNLPFPLCTIFCKNFRKFSQIIHKNFL